MTRRSRRGACSTSAAGRARPPRRCSARFPQAEVIALDLALPMLAVARKERGPESFLSGERTAEYRPEKDSGPLSLTAFSSVPTRRHSRSPTPASISCIRTCACSGARTPDSRWPSSTACCAPAALLLFSTFGPDTLKELRAAFAAVDATPHVSRFVDMHDIGDALLTTGFRDPVLERDDFTLTYADAPHADARPARDRRDQCRRANASAASPARRTCSAVYGAYEAFRRDGVLPATYEVVYAHAQAPRPGQPRRTPAGDVASFPLEGLRGSRRR